jgi:hypothetical protein
MLKTLSGQTACQDEQELRSFKLLLRKHVVRRYLEIGAQHGDTFYAVMHALPAGSYGVAVDLPGGAWGVENSRVSLTRAVERIKAHRREAVALFGDSHLLSTAQHIRKLGPFDAVFIDGDHTLSGVARDWELYGPMARLVAFHDIVGDARYDNAHLPPVEVPILWQRIKNAGYKVHELVTPGSAMGIGVVEML